VGERNPGGAALAAVSFTEPATVRVQPDWVADPVAFAEVRRQLGEYFAGTRKRFTLDLVTRGSVFQRRVWAAIEAVPYGSTTTYGRIAHQVGAPRDRVRAVAAAIGANPLLIVRPCHRVVGADGSLTGYAGGVPRKHALLTHEGALQPQLV
jgi:methylated-DNA-[protein]-cysteine S-methyltransferase